MISVVGQCKSGSRLGYGLAATGSRRGRAVPRNARRRAGNASNNAVSKRRCATMVSPSCIRSRQSNSDMPGSAGWNRGWSGPRGMSVCFAPGSAWRITKAARGSSWSKVAASTAFVGRDRRKASLALARVACPGRSSRSEIPRTALQARCAARARRFPHPAKRAVAVPFLPALTAAEYAARQAMHNVGQFVDPGEVFGALPGVVADFDDRVGDELRRDHSLGPAASPARSPGPHNLRLAESRSRERTMSAVPHPHLPQSDCWCAAAGPIRHMVERREVSSCGWLKRQASPAGGMRPHLRGLHHGQ